MCCVCSSFIPTYCVSTLTFCKGGAMSQSASTADADADADKDLDVVLDSLCFACPPTIVIEQCKLNLIVGVFLRRQKKFSLTIICIEKCLLDLDPVTYFDQNNKLYCNTIYCYDYFYIK